MTTKILNGKEAAAQMRAEMKERVAELKATRGIVPGLCVILVGENPASVSYVTAKERACAEIGIASDDNRLPENTSEEELLALIAKKNEDPAIHGILVQLPLPRHIDEDKIINAIVPEKDVDGFHPVNVGNMMIGRKCFLPCTPHGILQLLKINGISASGKHVVVVGRSNIVGKPVANLLLQKSDLGNATVTICHTGTRNMAEFTRQADILIVAAGRPDTVTGDMIKPGAVVVDVGVNRVKVDDCPEGAKPYRLVGDVDFASASEVASAITPVPGGVGPMTITMLLYNTVQSAEDHTI